MACRLMCTFSLSNPSCGTSGALHCASWCVACLACVLSTAFILLVVNATLRPRRALPEVILTEQELERLLHPDKAVAEHQLAAREAAERAFAQQNAAFKVSACNSARGCVGARACGKQQTIKHPCDANISFAMLSAQAEQQRLKREADSMAAQTPEAAAEVPPTFP